MTVRGIANVEEVAYRMGLIDAAQLKTLAEPLMKISYGAHLMQVVEKEAV